MPKGICNSSSKKKRERDRETERITNMYLSAILQSLFYFLLIVKNIVVCTSFRQDPGLLRQRYMGEIKIASSIFEWDVITPNPRILSEPEINDWEVYASKFFNLQLTSSPLFSKQDLITISINIEEQSIDVLEYTMKGDITIVYSSEEEQLYETFSNILSKIITNENAESMLMHDSQPNLFDDFSKSASITFTNPKNSDGDGGYENKRLIMLIALLAMSCSLTVTSIYFFHQSRFCHVCCPGNQQAEHEVKQTLTQDSSDNDEAFVNEKQYGDITAANYSTPQQNRIGKLGAAQLQQSDGGTTHNMVQITPQRGIYQEYETETPISVRTDISDNTFSTLASCDALGVVSKKSLDKLLHDPTQGGATVKQLYDLSLRDIDEK